ncbi:hypothetical protein GL263_04810 [Streptomyces durbertensis]|uniref:Uncharacterized protein n=1 Tax=Streptomyces durbertensis TaxID=2448886 RepID=A0ABR6EC32_9ACTN|nr:hypothetical protein [Streptomyces durbertensis]MBB1242890.1 hypothetical protein [Streptomyces durbertensis]
MSAQFVTETVDNTGAVVGNVCLTLDRDDNPWIAYIADQPVRNVQVARRTDAGWIREDTHVVAIADESRIPLAIDSKGNPHIACRDGDSGNLRWAFERQGSWTSQEVPTHGGLSPRPVSHISMTLHPGKLDTEMRDTPQFAFQEMFSARSLGYATKVGDNWSVEILDEDPIRETGLFASMAFDISEALRIAYFDFRDQGMSLNPQRLKMAVTLADGWDSRIVDDDPTLVGHFSSIPKGTTFTPFIAYWDKGSGDLIVWSPSSIFGDPGRKEVVAAALSSRPIPSAAVNLQSKFCVAYPDNGIRIATRHHESGEDAWGVQTVADTGTWPSLAYDKQGSAHIAYEAEGSLKYAREMEG